VLDKCKVDGARLEQTQALAQAAAEDKKVCLGLSRMTVIQGRLRLRDRVSTLLKTDERKAQARSCVFLGREWRRELDLVLVW
jgi:hypothetical protein